MKCLRWMVSVALLSIPVVTLAQSDAHDSSSKSSPQVQAVSAKAPSAAKQTFAQLKTLAGSWEGEVTMNPPMPGADGPTAMMHLTIRVTSRGNVIVHEFQQANTPLDAKRYDHPVTMLYVDADQLNLVHYCDAGNRPHMTAKLLPDSKSVEFDFADLSGGNDHGHMHHAVFTFIDANHHVEDWTYMMPGDKPMHAHFELKRVE